MHLDEDVLGVLDGNGAHFKHREPCLLSFPADGQHQQNNKEGRGDVDLSQQ